LQEKRKKTPERGELLPGKREHGKKKRLSPPREKGLRRMVILENLLREESLPFEEGKSQSKGGKRRSFHHLTPGKAACENRGIDIGGRTLK